MVPFQGELGEKDVISIINSLKNVANGVAGLNTAAQLNLAQLPLIPSSQLGFGFAWEQVARVSTPPTAPAATVSITNLPSSEVYMILVLAVGGDDTAFLQINGDTTGTGYQYLGWVNSQGTVSSKTQPATSPIPGCYVSELSAISLAVIYIFASAENGQTITLSSGSATDGTTNVISNGCGFYSATGIISSIELFTVSGYGQVWDVTVYIPKR